MYINAAIVTQHEHFKELYLSKYILNVEEHRKYKVSVDTMSKHMAKTGKALGGIFLILEIFGIFKIESAIIALSVFIVTSAAVALVEMLLITDIIKKFKEVGFADDGADDDIKSALNFKYVFGYKGEKEQ
jgi:hypothetical protein